MSSYCCLGFIALIPIEVMALEEVLLLWSQSLVLQIIICVRSLPIFFESLVTSFIFSLNLK